MMNLVGGAAAPPSAADPARCAAANDLAELLFAACVMSVQVVFAAPAAPGGRLRAFVAAARGPGGVSRPARPRRLPIHPAPAAGCAGPGPLADPRLPLPPLDRLWVFALRDALSGAPAGIPGRRTPRELAGWLMAHPEALPATATMTAEAIFGETSRRFP